MKTIIKSYWWGESWLSKLIRAIKEALQDEPNTSRAERRLHAKMAGRKRSDGKFNGNPSLPKANQEYKMIREIVGK